MDRTAWGVTDRPSRKRSLGQWRRRSTSAILVLAVFVLGFLGALPLPASLAWIAAGASGGRRGLLLRCSSSEDVGAAVPGDLFQDLVEPRRRKAVAAGVLATIGALMAFRPSSVRGIVQGPSAPDSYGIGKGFVEKASCTVLDECAPLDAGKGPAKVAFGDMQVTASGVKFKDLVAGMPQDGVAEPGKTVTLKYRVIRGGRSADGLSGKGPAIFSLGYGESDNEGKDAALTAPLGKDRFIKSLEEGLVGMAVGGVRRVQVRPDAGFGWRKQGKCEETFQLGLASGVPGAGTTNKEACLDDERLPQPRDFAQKRRFAKRYDLDQLVVEAELVGVGQV